MATVLLAAIADPSLKAEPRLQFNDAAAKCGLRLAELRIAGDAIVTDSSIQRLIVEVYLVEQVVGAGLQIQLSVLAENLHAR